MDYFIFDDFDSRNYGIYLHNSGDTRARILAPPKVNVTDRPLGTSGEILFDQYYDVKDIDLNLFTTTKQDNRTMQEVATYLSILGTKKLVLSYEDYKYYNATLMNQISANEYYNGMMIDTLNFKALSPFGFSTFTTEQLTGGGVSNIYYNTGLNYDSGLLYAETMPVYSFSNMTNNQQFSIYHGGNCNFAFPNFKFNGTANNIQIIQYSDANYSSVINTFSYGAINGSLHVDSSVKNTFRDGFMNNVTFTGDYVSLNGITTPKFKNRGVTNGIPSSTVTLSTSASIVNDFYNGSRIYILNNKNCVIDSRIITDYVGATRLATLNSPFTNISADAQYSIHSPTDGMNYFELRGTGFVNLGLTVDFRYVYL